MEVVLPPYWRRMKVIPLRNFRGPASLHVWNQIRETGDFVVCEKGKE